MKRGRYDPRVLGFAPLGALREPDRRRYGGKAVNLALMLRAGLPVPDGFALAFETERAPKLEPDEVEALRRAYAELPGTPAVAVRSSVVGEDGRELSFAGQYTTKLDVVGEAALCEAVEACLASQGSERAVSYRVAAEVTAGGMGVLVQRMVRAEYAGVCFTRSPLADDAVIVELVEGSAAGLVAGARRPARAVFAREGLRPAAEEDPEGVLERFDRERVRDIARRSLEAEACLGLAVDVEWAYEEGTFYLVQARPITATARTDAVEEIRQQEIERLGRIAAGRVLVWSDFSVADVLARLTPLTLEILQLFTAPGGSFDASLRALGLRYAGGRDARSLFESICGRAYMNLGWLVQSVDEALPVALDFRRLPELDGHAFDLEQLPVRLAWRGWRSVLRLPGALLRWLFVVPARFYRLRRGFDREFRERIAPVVITEAARLRDRDLTGLGGAELWAVFRSHLERFARLLYYHQVTDNIALPTHLLLRRNLRRLYGEKMDAMEVRLTTGLPGNFNTETNLDLARVAVGELEMEAFLDRYGHRGSPDYEVSAPRWREDPSVVESLARTIARAGVDPVAQFEEQQAVRAEAEAQFSADIRRDWWLRPWHDAILRELHYYQRYSPLREATQALAYLFIELARRALLEAARRSRLGDLVFYCSLAELRVAFTRGVDAARLERARAARERWRAAQRIYVPHVVRSDALEAIGRLPSMPTGAQELSGQAVSSGVARGRARVVQGLDEARELEAGEILVAASADPSWTPLFLVAGGLVLEQGGLLSHPAIVAREYGLPAVVNVANATRLLRTGQELTVDADAGRVLLLDRGAQALASPRTPASGPSSPAA